MSKDKLSNPDYPFAMNGAAKMNLDDETVQALAAYENEPAESVKMTERDVLRDGFTEPRRFEVLLAEAAGEAVVAGYRRVGR